MGLYFAEGGDSNKVLGLTCHHVLLKTDATTIDDYVFTGVGAPRKNVQLLGTRAFDKLLSAIKMRISRHAMMVGHHEQQIKRLEARVDDAYEEDVAEAGKKLEKTQAQLEDANKAIEDLEKFYETVKEDWGQASQRIIGHIRSSPAVSFNVGPKGFTEDWRAIELDGPKFRDAFKGNFIDLGTEIEPDIFIMKMYPHGGHTTFKYPYNRLLPLRDMITEERMREPDTLDNENEACSLVIKNGAATGVTIGRATGLFSFVRDDVFGHESMEWAIYNYGDQYSGVFAAPGDSGSIIVDGLGRIGGLLTGGTGKTDTSDVTYATPMWWLWPRIKQHFPHAHLDPLIMT